MGKNKTTGNMYDWVGPRWNPVGGACPIGCTYCYVNRLKHQYPQIAAKYSGPPRLTGPWPRFKKGEVVFVCSCTDLFAMPDDIVGKVLTHCDKNYDATFVFQTKVPGEALEWLALAVGEFFFLVGTTIESDRIKDFRSRSEGIAELREMNCKTFVTVEPVLAFTKDFAAKLIGLSPCFINIGADSGNNHLPEPTKDETLQLIADLRAAGIEVRIKPNLRRIIGKETT